jgi:hypothetical protein
MEPIDSMVLVFVIFNGASLPKNIIPFKIGVVPTINAK